MSIRTVGALSIASAAAVPSRRTQDADVEACLHGWYTESGDTLQDHDFQA